MTIGNSQQASMSLESEVQTCPQQDTGSMTNTNKNKLMIRWWQVLHEDEAKKKSTTDR
jgi:hypothetical protein